MKPSKIVVVRDADGEFQAFTTGDGEILTKVDLYVVDFAMCEQSEPEAAAVGIEEWSYLSRKIKSAVKNAAE